MNKELVKLCVDAVKNPTVVQHFAKGVSIDEAIRGEFYSLMGTEKPTYKDLRKHSVAVFEIIEEILDQTIINGVNEDDFFLNFADVRNLALGDTNEFYVEDNSMLVASKLSGNHWNITRQKLDVGDSFTVKTEAFGIGVYTHFFQFLTGRVDFAGLVGKVERAIKDKIAQEVAASFTAATAYLPTEFKASGAYDEAELTEIIAHVEASTGTQPVVLGTRQALAKITAGASADLMSNEMKNELNQTGRISNFKGMTLVQIPNVHKANSFDFAYDPKKLFILPSNDARPVKLVFEGDSMVKEVSDGLTNQDMSLEYKFLTRFGTSVTFNTLYGVYDMA